MNDRFIQPAGYHLNSPGTETPAGCPVKKGVIFGE
ncbi:Uncharacterised protein [Mycobacterium tuberculosis]|nr:Uncharacterised protein [Mycobacterium tuberculosis]